MQAPIALTDSTRKTRQHCVEAPVRPIKAVGGARIRIPVEAHYVPRRLRLRTPKLCLRSVREPLSAMRDETAEYRGSNSWRVNGMLVLSFCSFQFPEFPAHCTQIALHLSVQFPAELVAEYGQELARALKRDRVRQVLVLFVDH